MDEESKLDYKTLYYCSQEAMDIAKVLFSMVGPEAERAAKEMRTFSFTLKNLAKVIKNQEERGSLDE